MKKKAGRPRKVLSASERKAVVKMLRNTRNITATVNNLKATGLDISRTRVQAVARDEKLGFKAGAKPVRFTPLERTEVLAVLRKTNSIAATVAELADRGMLVTARSVSSVAKAEGVTIKPGPVPRKLTREEHAAIVSHLRKTKSITAVVLKMRRSGCVVSHAVVRGIATDANVVLAHYARRAATPKMLKIATKLHAKGFSPPMIAGEIYNAMGYAVTPQTVLKMLAASR